MNNTRYYRMDRYNETSDVDLWKIIKLMQIFHKLRRIQKLVFPMQAFCVCLECSGNWKVVTYIQCSFASPFAAVCMDFGPWKKWTCFSSNLLLVSIVNGGRSGLGAGSIRYLSSNLLMEAYFTLMDCISGCGVSRSCDLALNLFWPPDLTVLSRYTSPTEYSVHCTDIANSALFYLDYR